MTKRFNTAIPNAQGGAALVAGLLILLVITLVAVTSMSTTRIEEKMSGNYRTLKQILFDAEAGIQEALNRLSLPSTNANQIDDGAGSGNALWSVFIGDAVKAAELGYNSSDANHTLVSSLYAGGNPNYVIRVSHKLDTSNNVVYWDGINFNTAGDGDNVMVITSKGFNPTTKASHTVVAETARYAFLRILAALYGKTEITLNGSDTQVFGVDECYRTNNPSAPLQGLPSIATTLDTTTITNRPGHGTPFLEGFVGGSFQTGNASIQGNAPNININNFVNAISKTATLAADYSSVGPGSADTIATDGLRFDSPGAADDAACTDNKTSSLNSGNLNTANGSDGITYNVVHIKLEPGDTINFNNLSGCGALVISGDASFSGSLRWKGLIVASGNLSFSGSGVNVTDPTDVLGAVMSNSVTGLVRLRGQEEFRYCGEITDQVRSFVPFTLLNWKTQGL